MGTSFYLISAIFYLQNKLTTRLLLNMLRSKRGLKIPHQPIALQHSGTRDDGTCGAAARSTMHNYHSSTNILLKPAAWNSNNIMSRQTKEEDRTLLWGCRVYLQQLNSLFHFHFIPAGPTLQIFAALITNPLFSHPTS